MTRQITYSLLLSALLTGTLQAQASFDGLGWLNGGVPNVSRAYAISDNGLVIVGASSSTMGKQAFRWTANGGMVGLGVLPGGATSTARTVSSNGSVIAGESGSPDGEVAFRWTQATGLISMGDLAGGTVNSNALGMSLDGTVVVGEGKDANNHRAFRWTSGSGMSNLGLLGGPVTGESHAYDTSSDGSIVVGYSSDANGRLMGFKWMSTGGMTALGDLTGGTVESRAYGISSNGLYITGRSDAGANKTFKAFRWFGGKMINLGVAPGYRTSRGRDVSDDGTVVVGRCGNDTVVPETLSAFIWTDTLGMQELRSYLMSSGVSGLSGWKLEEAEAMTSDGRYVVGHGTNPQGLTEAWLVQLPVRVVSETFSAPSAVGGAEVICTIKTNYAVSSPTTVSLSSDSSAADVPSTVTIPAGETTATFKVTTHGVGSTTKVGIEASLGIEARVAVLTVKPAVLKSYTLAPSAPVYGGTIVTGKIKLSGEAPAGGVIVTLTSNSTVLSVPSQLTIAAGQTSVGYSASTAAVPDSRSVTLRATYGGVTKSVIVTVEPATLNSLAMKPTSIASGKQGTLTVTLLGKAATGGTTVALSSNSGSLTVPASIVVPAGASSASVKVNASAVDSDRNATVTATLGSAVKSVSVAILAPKLSAIKLSSSSVVGGTNVKGTVTLSGLAPAGGIEVSISTSSSVASAPATIVVPAGASLASFTITTSVVSNQRTVTISAALDGTTKEAVLTLTP